MKQSMLFLCSALLLINTLSSVQAHGLGLSLEEVVGEYLIDVGYDQQLIAGEQILFDFNLYNQRRDGLQDPTDYSSVAFEVSLNGTTVFSRQVARNAAKTFMTVVFPTSGQYGLHTIFFRDDEKFAETTFSVAVANPVSAKKMASPLDIFEIASYAVAVVICIGAGIGLLLTRSRRNSTDPVA
jgi:hypothetical protein